MRYTTKLDVYCVQCNKVDIFSLLSRPLPLSLAVTLCLCLYFACVRVCPYMIEVDKQEEQRNRMINCLSSIELRIQKGVERIETCSAFL